MGYTLTCQLWIPNSKLKKWRILMLSCSHVWWRTLSHWTIAPTYVLRLMGDKLSFFSRQWLPVQASTYWWFWRWKVVLVASFRGKQKLFSCVVVPPPHEERSSVQVLPNSSMETVIRIIILISFWTSFYLRMIPTQRATSAQSALIL